MSFKDWLREVGRRLAEGLSGKVPQMACICLAFGVAGCGSVGPASVQGGECKAFHDPGFAVQGKRLQDKQWIGKTQETGIQVCGWKRPRV